MLKLNGTLTMTRPDGTPGDTVPAHVFTHWAIVPRKQTRGTYYEMSHAPTGARLIGHDKPAALIRVAANLDGLPINWAHLTIDGFNALPAEMRQQVHSTCYEAIGAWEASEKERKAEQLASRIASRIADDAKYRAGVPFSEAPAAKPYKMITPQGDVLTGDVNGETWVSDGYIAHVGTVPDDYHPAKQAPIAQVIPARFDHEARPVAYYQDMNRNRLTVLSDGVVLNYDMFRSLMRKFKGATIQCNGGLGPVGYVLEGKIVAIQMPVVSVSTTTPAAVLAILEDSIDE